jgi:hypothetical protein
MHYDEYLKKVLWWKFVINNVYILIYNYIVKLMHIWTIQLLIEI